VNDCSVKRSIKHRKVPVSTASVYLKIHRRESLYCPDFRGARIIDENGAEITITEAMVQNACNSFIQLWEVTQQKLT
jgi:hypothetical protein